MSVRITASDDALAVLGSFDDATSDVVTLDGVLATHPDPYDVLFAVARVLRPGGRLIATVTTDVSARGLRPDGVLLPLHAFFPDVDVQEADGERRFVGQRANPRTVVPRDAARVLLLDPDDRLLLLEGETPAMRRFWIAPGGGLEPGEGHAVAARREIREELGIDVDPGRAIWRRTHAFRWKDRVIEQTERYFVARVDSVDIRPERLDEYVVGHGWWTLAEIRAATDTAFAPRRLATLLAPVLEGRIPTFPIDVGP